MTTVKLHNKMSETVIITSSKFEYTLPEDCSTILRLLDGIYTVCIEGVQRGKFRVTNSSLKSKTFAITNAPPTALNLIIT